MARRGLNVAAAGGSTTLNGITAATGNQAGIANAAYTIQWNWDTLAGGTALTLSSASTAAASNAQEMLNISLSGTNGTSAQSTYGEYISNTHAGTTSSNFGLYATASGGTTQNTAIEGATSGTNPYLLRNLPVTKPDQVWATDITYIPMAHGFVYLVAGPAKKAALLLWT
jgi:hypothetical protein